MPKYWFQNPRSAIKMSINKYHKYNVNYKNYFKIHSNFETYLLSWQGFSKAIQGNFFLKMLRSQNKVITLTDRLL